MYTNSIPKNEETSNTLRAAISYVRRGWRVIPIPSGEKNPYKAAGAGWQNLRLTEDELPGRFVQGENVGVLLGEPSGGLTDIDLDCLEAIALAGAFMPKTQSIFGRAGKPKSHWEYITTISATRQFKDINGNTLVEIRSTGGQTVFPPSTHESGEAITWHEDGEPARVDADELLAAAGKLAAAALIARHWPAKGSRDDAAMALTGGLIRAGWSESETSYFVEAVALAAGDEEIRMRANKARGTAAKINAGRPATGLKRLGELIGVEVVSKVRDWLGISSQFDDEWPEPEEIQTVLQPVEPLPPAIIPEPFRDWLTDISYRMQCPIDFVATAAIVVAGAVIGAGCGIRPKQKDDWLVIPNLWGGVVGRPSVVLKTPSLTEVMKPLSRLEVEARNKYEQKMKYYGAEFEAFKATKEAIKGEMLATAKNKSKNKPVTPGTTVTTMDTLKDSLANLEEPDTPVRRRFKTNDATVEKMTELQKDNPRGLLLFRDELVGLLVTWDQENRQGDRAYYLESWNGYGSRTDDRIGRGTIESDNLCVSIFGGI